MTDIEAKIYFWLSTEWVECADVVDSPGPRWGVGLAGAGPLDVLASTGQLIFYLDNGLSNSEATIGLYSPGHPDCLAGFGDGLRVRVVLTVGVDEKERYVGEITSIRPTAGAFNKPLVEVQCDDWAGRLSTQEAGAVEVATDKRGDEMILATLDQFNVKPGCWVELVAGDSRTFEAGTGEWHHNDCSFESSASEAYAGTHSLKVTCDTGTKTPFIYIPLDGVQVGEMVEFSIRVKIPQAWPVKLEILINENDSGGGYAGTQHSGGEITCPSGGWVEYSGLFEIEEDDCEQIAFYLYSWGPGTFAGELLYLDEVKIAHWELRLDLEEGIETFPLVFHTVLPDSSMAEVYQSVARNESGLIYLKCDGTLAFENRYHRPMATAADFALDGEMSEFEVLWEREVLINYVDAVVRVAKIDAAASTQIWDLQEQGTPKIGPGETFEITCEFRDPDTGSPIAAKDVVSAVTYEFGTKGDYTSDNLHSYISQDNDLGSTKMIVRLTNTHETKEGYLNDLQVFGKGIYLYDAMTVNAKNDESIAQRDKRKLSMNLDLLTDPNTGRQYASRMLGRWQVQKIRVTRIQWLANQSATLADAALNAEVSSRVTVTEQATGVDHDFFVNALGFELEEQSLWMSALLIPAAVYNTFLWDSTEYGYDDPEYLYAL